MVSIKSFINKVEISIIMYGENVTPEMIDALVLDLSKKHPGIAKEDTHLIVSATLDNYCSEQGIRRFYEKNAEKLKLPVVMDHIRTNTHQFFYIESHFSDDEGYRMLEDVPIEELKTAKTYSPYIDMFAGIEAFVAQHKQ